MNYKHFAKGGVIDFFQPSFTHDEIIQKITSPIDLNNPNTCGLDRKDCSESSIDSAVEQIRQAIYKKDKEYPEKISFFSIPNFEYLRMDVYAVAKIGRDGSTYVFGNDKSIIRALAPETSEIMDLE